ncbi:pyridoxal-phosphate dependent enzyme [Croceimicrobium sp.]|uniref:pyridoxal-phosphate dependent enzyme n=1 Tax=Croceimicrobium sp. TaxID=2828340 RepID=UPI003BACAAC1
MKDNFSLEELVEAQRLISPHIHRTPVLSSKALNSISGATLFFKCENFQKTGSFKARGATHAILRLSEDEKRRGVATHSSGNHGQALAWAAQKLGIACHVVMPENAPEVKIAAVQNYGAEVHLCAPNLAAREAGLKAVQDKFGAVFIPPYNHPHIIAGQSTAATELLEDYPDLDLIISPVGGGGLLAGTALSNYYFSKRCQVIAGEPEGANDAFQSFYSGNLVKEHQTKTIADGLLTTLGEINFPIIQELVLEIITVSETEIVEALKLIYQRLKIVVEPSSAVALAAILQQAERYENRRIGIILSGGNVDLAKLPF